MFKKLTKVMYSGVASVFALAAMANISTTSVFMIYQPDLPSEEDIG